MPQTDETADSAVQVEPDIALSSRARASTPAEKTLDWATRMRAQVSERIRRRPGLFFWISFSILNCLLFVPLFLLNAPEIPGFVGGANRLQRLPSHMLLSRESFDPFRLNLEFLILATAWTTIHRLRRPVFRKILIFIYFVTLAYAIYEGITLSLWQSEPVFYTHYFMALDGIRFLLDHLHLPAPVYIGATTLTFSAAALIFGLLQLMTGTSPALGRGARRTLVALSLGACVAALLAHSTVEARASERGISETSASPTMVVSSLTAKLGKNIERSLEIYARSRSNDADLIDRTYDFSAHHLADRPNIYLIFVESYGSVLYKRDDYRLAYKKLLNQLEPQLDDAGLHAATTLSEAPTWGGGSWMSYTSALFGLRIEEHPSYLALVDRYQERDYPDLGSYLQSQGYFYNRVSSLATELKDEVWTRYTSFFGVDEWLRYRDLDYVGQRYGWGPAPPDQYVLNFADAATQARTDDPRVLFLITQNSHYPWAPLPEIVEDWHSLNIPAPDQAAISDDELEHATRRQNYFNAIEYELRFLTDFMIEHEDEDAIFVLIGDHQPPRVSRRSDGWDTPIHIISRDADFVDSFDEYGFVPGLQVQEVVPTMRHEGFYTMFLRQLLSNYGETPSDLPPYFPQGIVLDTSTGEE